MTSLYFWPGSGRDPMHGTHPYLKISGGFAAGLSRISARFPGAIFVDDWVFRKLYEPSACTVSRRISLEEWQL